MSLCREREAPKIERSWDGTAWVSAWEGEGKAPKGREDALVREASL